MATQEDLNALEREGRDDKDGQNDKDKDRERNHSQNGDAVMQDVDGKAEKEEANAIDEEILRSSAQDINVRRRLLENDLRIMKSEKQRLTHEKSAMNEKIKDNLDKIENNRYVGSGTEPIQGTLHTG